MSEKRSEEMMRVKRLIDVRNLKLVRCDIELVNQAEIVKHLERKLHQLVGRVLPHVEAESLQLMDVQRRWLRKDCDNRDQT